MKNIKQITLSVFALLMVVGGVYAYTQMGVDKASANPDYICVKSVEDQPCEVDLNDLDACEAWQPDGTRVCEGTRATSVFYRLTRTSCEPGYTRYHVGEVGGASGRRTPDMTYTSESCTVVQTDHTAPVGAGG